MMKIRGFSIILLLSLFLTACGSGTVPPAASPQPPVAGLTPAPTEMSAPTAESMPLATEMSSPTAENLQAATEMTVPTVGSVQAATQAPVVLTSKKLNLYGWSEYVPQALLEGFTKEYGVKVNYDTYSSNEELMAKLQAGASGYDVIIPSDYTVAIMVKQGLLEPLDLAQLPNLANIGDSFRNLPFDPGNQYSVPYLWGTVGLAVNTQKVTKPVTSWADLWDPAYKGRVVLPDDEREVLGMVLMVLGYDKNSTSASQLEQAKTKMKELLPNVKLFDSDSPKTALLSGEVWLGQIWNGEAALAHKENPAIDYLCPKEGCGIWYDNLAIPKGAPHQDAAVAFLNYILRPDVSLLITKEFPYSNPNQAALDLMKQTEPDQYKEYMGFRATNPSAEEIKNAKPVIDVGDATTLWDQVWTEVKSN